jgi:hypothetical protein
MMMMMIPDDNDDHGQLTPLTTLTRVCVRSLSMNFCAGLLDWVRGCEGKGRRDLIVPRAMI